VKIPNDLPQLLGAPEDLVAAVHRLGESEGYQRVRLDRGTAGSGAWYEVGFSGGEVRVRWSHVGTADYQVASADTDTLRVIAGSMRMNITEAQGQNGDTTS
jgi:hypothetical protein